MTAAPLRLSGSRLPILQRCQWWARPDADYPDRPRTKAENEAGDAGSENHEGIATALLTGRVDELSPDAAMYVEAVRRELTRVPTEVLGVEVAVALDTRTWQPRVLGQNIGRAYAEHGLQPGELPFTIDLMIRRQERLCIVDYKSGWGDGVDAPDANWQTLVGCLAFVGRGEPMRSEVWYVKPNKVWIESADVDLFDVENFRGQLARVLALTPTASANPGAHCTWCDACGACPATRAMLGKLVEAADAFGWSTAIQGPDHARWMLERLPLIEKATGAIREALKQHADAVGGIELESGKVWRAVECKRSSLNMPAVKNFLGPRLGEFMAQVTYNQYRAVNK